LLEATGVDRSVPAPKVSSDEIGAATKINKEVDEVKRIVFLIIASLLVLGLVLTGCGEPTPENVIYIAVCGPMTDIQGQNHWDGANMAVDELGTVTINGTEYELRLRKVETREATEGETGSTGTANLQAVIDDVTFCVGGFRTEVVSVYRSVAMDAKKIFFNCGAATGSLQFSVVTNYSKYKYWFKATPYNESFLVTSLLKMTSSIGAALKGYLQAAEAANASCVKDDYKVSLAVGGKLRVEILMENAAWCAGMVLAAQAYLPLYGYNVTGTTLVSPTAADISGSLSTLAARFPHIIFTAFSGSVGAVYSIQKNSLGIPGVTLGINVPGQQLAHWTNTAGACKGEIMLDTWPVGVNITPLTSAWFNAFVAQFSRYPLYTAATYDAIKSMCAAIEATNSLDADTLITWLEDPANKQTGVGATTAYYPMPAITYNATIYALSSAQVATLYNLASYNKTYVESAWQCGYNGTSQKPHIAHDTCYGPGYQTGTGSQWQLVSGAGKKVGIWPYYTAGADAVRTDQYGNWNFAYPGTVSLDWATMLAGFLLC
jgi:branched-chain amino acid transport system substrate-binding protein